MENNLLPKWLVNGLGALLMVFVAFLIVQQIYNFNQVVKNQKPANTITVSADGKVSAVPDLAVVNIGVMTQGAAATDVKNQNNDKVNKVIAFIKQQGIADGDITTSQISLYPQQSYPVVVPGAAEANNAPKIIGYQGDQTVTVKVHGVNKDQSVLEKILDGAVNAGANEVQGLSFAFNDPNALQQQARKLAIDNAKTKAQELAKEAGLNLGKVVSISESNAATPLPYALNAPLGMGGGAAKSIAPDIQPGSQDITESMSVTFEVQ